MFSPKEITRWIEDPAIFSDEITGNLDSLSSQVRKRIAVSASEGLVKEKSLPIAEQNRIAVKGLEEVLHALGIKPEQAIRPRNLNEVHSILRMGPRSVMLKILETEYVVSKKEDDTDKEEIYLYQDGFYSRGEETLRKKAYQIYIDEWEDAFDIIVELIEGVSDSDPDTLKKYLGLKNEIRNNLDKGPAKSKLDEVLAQIRLKTFVDPSRFNPPSHIPFKNGLLTVSDWRMVKHNPELIYLWRVEAELLADKLDSISLNDCPTYKKFLTGSFEPFDIPMLLQYGGYSFLPGFPRQMVMFIVGRPRIGKGTNARIWKGLNPTGYGSISFEKLMIAENRFPFQNIRGKNLLVDAEIKRKFKKGARPDYSNFNKLFGGDTVDLEKKGRTPEEYESTAKGLFLANLPLPPIEDEPFLLRVLLIRARDVILKPKDIIPNLDDIILKEERDEIATLFVRYLKVLQSYDFKFLNEYTGDATMELWDAFSNVLYNFMDELIEYSEGSQIDVDEAYGAFEEWCKKRGIPVIKSQTFKRNFGRVYQKKRVGTRGERAYAFINCKFAEEVEVKVTRKVDTEVTIRETRDIRELYDSNKRVQLRSYYLDKKIDVENIEKEIEPKLDNSDEGIETPETPSPDNIKGVSNTDKLSEPKLGLNVYKTVDLVLGMIKKWGLGIDEYSRAYNSSDRWKVKLSGQLENYTKEQKDFLRSGFNIPFEGTVTAPHTWIHFQVRQAEPVQSKRSMEGQWAELGNGGDSP